MVRRMMLSGIWRGVVPLLLLAFPTGAVAERGALEITPTFGLCRAGGITIENRTFEKKSHSIDVGNSGSVGLVLDIAVTKHFAFELLFSHQAGAFEDKAALFGEEPGGFVSPGDQDLLDVEIIWCQGGFLCEYGPSWTRGFLAGRVGLVRVDPSLPLPDDTLFSFSLGGGFKMDLSDRLGVRLEGRIYRAKTDQGIEVVEKLEHRDCLEPCTYTYRYQPDFTQSEISLGLIVRP